MVMIIIEVCMHLGPWNSAAYLGVVEIKCHVRSYVFQQKLPLGSNTMHKHDSEIRWIH